MKTTTNYIDDEIKHKTQLVQDIRVEDNMQKRKIVLLWFREKKLQQAKLLETDW